MWKLNQMNHTQFDYPRKAHCAYREYRLMAF
jgi:hypothetical protein